MAHGNDQSTNLLAILGAAAVGAVVGATAALLLAPKSGQEMREDLKDLAEKTKDRAEDLKERVGAKVDEMKVKLEEHLPKKGEAAEKAAEEA